MTPTPQGRTHLYIHQSGAEDGVLIGMVNAPELARRFCDAMNARLADSEDPAVIERP
ncbi:hypothetical protein [Actinomadura spongiicola]|uniref:hypothetical protein n=1 Tax=Actinomadura spongiicola TaxID=2303421 RepID=UPI001314E8DD|nr:hypothetical protein [Actinomadura spongiicola]